MNTILAILLSLSSVFHNAPKTLWNCEDKDVTPCYMYDEGKWMHVRSFDPYRASPVKLCKTTKKHCLGKPDSKNRRTLYS